jgi:hypothetical protein
MQPGVSLVAGVTAVGQALGASTSGIFNAQPLNHTRLALAGVLSGQRQMKIGFIGDSTTTGVTPSVPNLAGGQLLTPAQQTVNRLLAMGWKARCDSCMGSQSTSLNTPALVSGYDPRITIGANISFGTWSFSDAAGTGVAADTFSFTPSGAFDTIEIYTPVHSTYGSIAVTVGATSYGTINCSGANAFLKTKLSIARVTGGATAVNLAITGQCYMQGIICYDSTAPAITTFNMGYAGITLATVATTNAFPWNPGYSPSVQNVSGLGCFGADLWVIYLGLNDQPTTGNTPPALFQQYVEEMITNCASGGTSDVVVTTMWGNAIDLNVGDTQAYNQLTKNACLAMGVPCIDQFPFYGTSAQGVAAGLIGSDGTHPTPLGYGDRGNVYGDFVGNMT